jgi:hypothetical protein
MKKRIATALAVFIFVSCSNEKKKVEDISSYHEICMINSEIKNCINSSNNKNKDVFMLLEKVELYNVIPDSGKYFGKPGLTITDTLGGGIFDTIGGFSMDDSYCNQYKYNGDGLISNFSYIDAMKPEDCIEVAYKYKGQVLYNILATNPHLSTSADDKDSMFYWDFASPDTLYSLDLKYDNKGWLTQLLIFQFRNKEKVKCDILYK